jgi:chloramphenicol 3-O phosphotransferase
LESRQGTVIFINGVSSVGKTSISQLLVKSENIKIHHLSIDEFSEKYALNYVNFINHMFPDLEASDQDSDDIVVPIIIEPIIKMYYSTIKLFAATGRNVVVDTVIDSKEKMKEFLDLMSGIPVMFVGVKCSREELARREHVRGDGKPGLAWSQYEQVYAYEKYDLVVDTERLSPAEAANEIIHFIETEKNLTAIDWLRKTMT